MQGEREGVCGCGGEEEGLHGHEGPAVEDVVEEGCGHAAGVAEDLDGEVAFEFAFKGLRC